MLLKSFYSFSLNADRAPQLKAGVLWLLFDGKCQPKLLWRFEAGDRGEGGLRSVYADSGDLIVELYGRKSTAEEPYASSATSVEDGGACCPSYFTRTRYEWRQEKFTRKGESEIVKNPDRDASPRMYRASLNR